MRMEERAFLYRDDMLKSSGGLLFTTDKLWI